MKNNFTIFDETSNDRKKAESILRFEINGKEYLIYTINNGDDNTRIILLSGLYKQDNKYSIGDITKEEKDSLNSLIYDIMMSLPFQKNKEGAELINEFIEKNGIKITLNLPELSVEKYYANSLIARVNSEIVEKAIDFYHIYLDENENNRKEENNISINTWEIPSAQQIAPISENFQEVPQLQIDDNLNGDKVNIDGIIPQSTPANNTLESDDMTKINLSTESVVPQNTNVSINETPSTDQVQTDIEMPNDEKFPNPQAEMLAMMNNLNTNTNFNVQPNAIRTNERGNVNTKYVIIGTVCIILALVVVAVTYILINNLK